MGIFDKLFGKKKREKEVEDLAKDFMNGFDEAVSNQKWGEVIKYGEVLAPMFKDIGDRETESIYYGGLGVAYWSLGDFKKAVENYKKALKIAKDIGDGAREAACYVGLSAVYHSLGDYKKALGYMNDLINAFSGAFEKGQWKEVIKYGEQLAQMFRDSENKAEESGCYNNLGVAYYNLGDFKKAIEYYEKALEIFKDIDDVAKEAICYTNLGNAYRGLGDLKKTTEYFKKAKKIAKDIGRG